MIKKRGGYVVGMTPESINLPSNICDVVINTNSKTLVEDVINGCKGIGAHLYIPHLNGTPIEQIIKMLTPSAVIVDYIGSITDFSINQIMAKSLFLTSPSMIHYKSLKNELILTFDEILTTLNSITLQMSFTEYKFDQIDDAFLQVSTAKSSDIVVVKL